MDYRIDYKKSVAKDLKRIGKANAKRIMDKIGRTSTGRDKSANKAERAYG